MNHSTHMISSDYENFNFVGWKSYNQIKKKAMEQEFSWSGLLISLSIAFFIVLVSAHILNLMFHSLEETKNYEKNIINQKMYQAGSFKFANQFSELFAVKKAYAFSENSGKIDKWTDYLNMEAGQVNEYSAEFKNTGDAVWKKEDVSLETGPFLNTVSQVYHSSWEKKYQVSFLSRDVLPGETYVFKFKLKAPADINGTIQENFQLVSKRFPIKGTTLRLFIDLKSVEMLNDKAEANISEKKINESENLKVINNNKKIEEKKIENKILSSTKNQTDFCAALSYDEKQDYENCRTALQENDLSDGIVKSEKLISEPILRIGIFNSSNAQRLFTNSYYDVYSGNDLLISGLRPGYVSTVSFDKKKKQYSVTTPGITKFSLKPLRFIPRNNNAVFTLMDFENRARWNANINYNQYRRIIEFQYSKETDKLWIINELPISQYLKGLTETSNYSPVEYQKVVATAARTYAMYHYNRGIEYNIPYGSTKHGYEHFHLDATYDQVYKGYVSEELLTRLSQAVDETKGVVVTYKGDVVVTPYYSRSDGRTRSWEEVWYGDPKPWLKSVSVPQDAGQELWGHGVGMSARGALIMARDEQKDWQYILKYFYQNTELKKIY